MPRSTTFRLDPTFLGVPRRVHRLVVWTRLWVDDFSTEHLFSRSLGRCSRGLSRLFFLGFFCLSVVLRLFFLVFPLILRCGLRQPVSTALASHLVSGSLKGLERPLRASLKGHTATTRQAETARSVALDDSERCNRSGREREREKTTFPENSNEKGS